MVENLMVAHGYHDLFTVHKQIFVTIPNTVRAWICVCIWLFCSYICITYTKMQYIFAKCFVIQFAE